jgi:2-iminobutanoate/2-iminopropanoate deaminase
MIHHFQPDFMPKSDAPYSPMVLDENYAYLSGLVAADFPEGQAVLGDVANETQAVLTAIGRMLREFDLDMDRIVRVDVHLVTLDDFDSMDAAYREFFEKDKYPARTTTQSDGLFGGSLVEITCMARRRQ